MELIVAIIHVVYIYYLVSVVNLSVCIEPFTSHKFFQRKVSNDVLSK